MRILMIVPQMFYSTRGTPLSAYHRIRDLTALGHEVEVLTYKGGMPAPDPTLVVHRSKGPHFAKSVRQGPSYAKIWFDGLLFLRLCSLLPRERYDLLYAHEEGGFLAALVAPIFRVPLVLDMHSSLPLQIRDWKFSDRDWVVGAFDWVERFTLKRSIAALAISPAVADAARRASPATPVEVVVNRFDDDTPADPADRGRVRRELGIAESERVVLYTGSFVALQSLDLLIAAAPAVVRAVPEARFVLVGGKPGELAELERLVRAAGVANRVTLLPARPQSEMAAFASAADVLVSPRVQGINPPGKLFSYLSSGRPVVATDTLVHNQILDARCAILTRPDAEGLAEGLIAALTDAARVDAVVAGRVKPSAIDIIPIAASRPTVAFSVCSRRAENDERTRAPPASPAPDLPCRLSVRYRCDGLGRVGPPEHGHPGLDRHAPAAREHRGERGRDRRAGRRRLGPLRAEPVVAEAHVQGGRSAARWARTAPRVHRRGDGGEPRRSGVRRDGGSRPPSGRPERVHRRGNGLHQHLGERAALP